MKRRQRALRRLLVLLGSIAACVAIVVTIMVMRDAARETLVVEARAQGMTAYEHGQYADALPHLSYYVSSNRSDAEVLLAFADARSKVPLENNRHLQEAARLYGVAIDLQPENIHAHLQLMRLHERLQRRLEWREAAERVLSLDPDNVDALRSRATALYLNSQFDDAEAVCARLIALEPDEVTWRVFYLQIMQDRGDRLTNVLDTCSTWIASHETDGRYHLLKAQLLTAIGRLDEARRVAATAVERGANGPLVLEHLVALLDGLLLHAQADELIASTKQRYPQEQWAYEASVRRHWKTGDYQRALEEIEQVSAAHDRLGGGLLRWKNLLATVSGGGGDREAPITTEPLAGSAQNDIPDDRDVDLAWAKAAVAKTRLDADDVREAIQVYREALALEPSDPVLHYLTGEAYARAGEHHLAASALEHAVRSDPGWVTAQTLYAKTLLRLERYEAAATLASRLMQRGTEPDLETCLLLARAWLSANLRPEEIGLYDSVSSRPVSLTYFLEHLLQESPDHPDVVELLTLAYLRDGQTDKAVALIESTLDDRELTSDLLLALTRISETHNLRLESRILRSGIDRLGVGADSELAMLRARLLHRSGEVDAARLLIDQAPGDSRLATKARSAYLAWAGHPDAVDALNAVLDQADNDIKSVSFVLSQSPTWHDAELSRRAIDMLENIVGPDAPRVALARATYTLQFESANPAAVANAMLLTNRVLASAPDSLNALRLMAMLYLASDPSDVEGATQQLARAIQSHPRRIELYPRIIRLLQRQGNHIEADRYLAEMGRLVGEDQSLLYAELLLLEAQGDLDGIIARLGNVTGVFDTVAQQIALAVTWNRSGDSDQAAVMLDQLLGAEPDNPAVLSVVAQFHASKGRIEKGFQLLRMFESRAETGVSAMLLGVYAQRAGAMEEAGQWLRLALQRSPERLEIWHHLASHYLSTGNYDEARTVADAGLRRDPENIGLLMTFATASIHLGGRERREALRMLDTVDCRAEALVATLHLYDRVVAARDRGEYSEFLLADLRDLVQRHPELAEAWRLAISTHVQAGKLVEAANLAKFATTRLPSTAEFAELATHVLILMSELPDALEMAMTWRQRSLHQPIAADTVIAALQLDLQQAHNAANQLSNHVDRIVKERQDAPQRLDLLMRAYAADRRFEQLSLIASPVLHENDRWTALLMDIAGRASEEDAKVLQSLVQSHSVAVDQP